MMNADANHIFDVIKQNLTFQLEGAVISRSARHLQDIFRQKPLKIGIVCAQYKTFSTYQYNVVHILVGMLLHLHMRTQG